MEGDISTLNQLNDWSVTYLACRVATAILDIPFKSDLPTGMILIPANRSPSIANAFSNIFSKFTIAEKYSSRENERTGRIGVHTET